MSTKWIYFVRTKNEAGGLDGPIKIGHTGSRAGRGAVFGTHAPKERIERLIWEGYVTRR